MCVSKGTHRILISYIDLVFNPNVMHEMLSLDLLEKVEESIPSLINLINTEKGHILLLKTGPKPLQKNISCPLDAIVDYIPLHGFVAHLRKRYQSTLTSNKGW